MAGKGENFAALVKRQKRLFKLNIAVYNGSLSDKIFTKEIFRKDERLYPHCQLC